MRSWSAHGFTVHEEPGKEGVDVEVARVSGPECQTWVREFARSEWEEVGLEATHLAR